MQPQSLDFSFNWNMKLSCNSFTTIRLRNDSKYYVGAEMVVNLGKSIIGMCKVMSVKTIKLHKINDWIAYLDTCYDAEKTKTIIMEMYKNKGIDWGKQELHYVMLKRL